MIVFAEQKQEYNVENKLTDTKEERRNGEVGISTYMIPCIKQITHENLLYMAKGTLFSALW